MLRYAGSSGVIHLMQLIWGAHICPAALLKGVHVKILMLIRSWNRGGAERQCALTTRELARRGHEVQAVSVYPGGCFQELAAETGATIVHLGRVARLDAVSPFLRLLKRIETFDPDVIYSFMPLANIAAVLCRASRVRAACVWGVRASGTDMAAYGVLSRLSQWIERRLIHIPETIICNSEASRRELSKWRTANVMAIENGIDTDLFKPIDGRRVQSRTKLGVSKSDRLIGIVGRLDPMKDHITFLHAAAVLAARNPAVRFLVAGGSARLHKNELQARAKELSIAERIIWLGATDDVAQLYEALDVIVSSSAFGEGFSNVIAEAMACGVPAVVTDVGDSARLVGDTGLVVQPRSPETLAESIETLLNANLSLQGTAARDRINKYFGLDTCTSRTEAVLSEAISRRARAGAAAFQSEPTG